MSLSLPVLFTKLQWLVVEPPLSEYVLLWVMPSWCAELAWLAAGSTNPASTVEHGCLGSAVFMVGFDENKTWTAQM